jgi:hypothetical protein
VNDHAAADDLLLSEPELIRLTGYKRAAEQLEELKRQGFYRARRNRLGELVLERAHYDAVCAAAHPAQRQSSEGRPRVLP